MGPYMVLETLTESILFIFEVAEIQKVEKFLF